MAQGSEAMKWILFPGVERVCRKCGRELKIADVGEHRKEYPSQRTTFLCVTCQKERVDEMVEKRRQEFGLGRKSR